MNEWDTFCPFHRESCLSSRCELKVIDYGSPKCSFRLIAEALRDISKYISEGRDER